MMKFKLYSSSLAATAALVVAQGVAAQDLIPIDIPEEGINLIGLGVFAVPDYYGSSTEEAAVAPILRYGFAGKRYAQLLGPELTVNVIDRTDWRAGPLIRGRPRRDSGVDDGVVRLMQPVPAATEFGAFVSYHLPLDSQPLHKVVFTVDVVGNTSGVYSGVTSNLRANYIHPFAQPMAGRQLIGSIGFGLFFASDHFSRRYFGVSGADLPLFPSQGGVPYRPDGGLVSIKIPFSLTTNLTKEWLVTVAGRYERLLGDAKDSPVVGGRGDANQWVIGIAGAYIF